MKKKFILCDRKQCTKKITFMPLLYDPECASKSNLSPSKGLRMPGQKMGHSCHHSHSKAHFLQSKILVWPKQPLIRYQANRAQFRYEKNLAHPYRYM